MSFQDFIDSVGSQDLLDLSEKEKERAVNAWLTDPSKKEMILQAFSDYLIDDHHIASALLLGDCACGRSIKNSIYAAIESDMQDTIHGLK